MNSDRPNILVIVTDEHCAEAMSCAGNSYVRTSAIDGLAARGVRFDRAYCTYPLCTPARASIFSGQTPHQVGVYANEAGIAEHWRSTEIGNVMSAEGYECAYGGKWHLPEWSMPDGHGFGSFCPLSDWELAGRCIDFFRQPRDGRPFFMVASFDNPHNICEWSRQMTLPWGGVDDVPTEQCPNLPANFAIPAYEPEAVQAERCPRPRSIFRGGSFTEDDWRHYRHIYFRLVEKVDAEIGRVLHGLREAGLEEKTVVIFTSDHGDGLGAHRWNQKSVLYEESVRVPLIVRAPNLSGAAGRTDRAHVISAGLDLAPTICDFAGVEAPTCWQGRSLRPLLRSDAAGSEWRSHVVIETFFGPEIGGLNTHGRAVIGRRYKYMLYSWGKYREQLIDLDTDPGEMVNLAVEARHRGVLDEHRHLLTRWFAETGDRFEPHYAHPDSVPPVPGQDYRPKNQR